MSSAVSKLKSKFSECVCSSCSKLNCKLNLGDDFPSERIILDIDCIAKNKRFCGKRCDYLIAVNKDSLAFIIPVEFKTKRMNVNDVKQQLEGGISFVINFFEKNQSVQIRCCPVLVSKSLKRRVGKDLQKIVINCRGKKARVKHVPCNGSLRWNKVKLSI